MYGIGRYWMVLYGCTVSNADLAQRIGDFGCARTEFGTGCRYRVQILYRTVSYRAVLISCGYSLIEKK